MRRITIILMLMCIALQESSALVVSPIQYDLRNVIVGEQHVLEFNLYNTESIPLQVIIQGDCIQRQITEIPAHTQERVAVPIEIPSYLSSGNHTCNISFQQQSQGIAAVVASSIRFRIDRLVHRNISIECDTIHLEQHFPGFATIILRNHGNIREEYEMSAAIDGQPIVRLQDDIYPRETRTALINISVLRSDSLLRVNVLSSPDLKDTDNTTTTTLIRPIHVHPIGTLSAAGYLDVESTCAGNATQVSGFFFNNGTLSGPMTVTATDNPHQILYRGRSIPDHSIPVHFLVSGCDHSHNFTAYLHGVAVSQVSLHNQHPSTQIRKNGITGYSILEGDMTGTLFLPAAILLSIISILCITLLWRKRKNRIMRKQ
ncbi:MAG: hypothetical protein ACOCWQ_00920 [Nanoarchaeota archaeon]